MAIRISGVIIPNEKRVEVALTYIYGLGLSKAKTILKSAEINPDTRVKDLSDDQANKLRELVEKKNKVERCLQSICLVFLLQSGEQRH